MLCFHHLGINLIFKDIYFQESSTQKTSYWGNGNVTFVMKIKKYRNYSFFFFERSMEVLKIMKDVSI